MSYFLEDCCFTFLCHTFIACYVRHHILKIFILKNADCLKIALNNAFILIINYDVSIIIHHN